MSCNGENKRAMHGWLKNNRMNSVVTIPIQRNTIGCHGKLVFYVARLSLFKAQTVIAIQGSREINSTHERVG